MEELAHRQTKKTIREIFEDWELDEVVGLPISVMAPPETKEEAHEDPPGISADDSESGPWEVNSQEYLLRRVREAQKARREFLEDCARRKGGLHEFLWDELRQLQGMEEGQTPNLTGTELSARLSAMPYLMVPWNYRGR